MQLFTSLPLNVTGQRLREYGQCLRINLLNPSITKVVLFADKANTRKIDVRLAKLLEQVHLVYVDSRPTYATLIEKANQSRELTILANADIFFDETLQLLRNHSWPDDLLIHLTRREATIDHAPRTNHFEQGIGSGDSWVFRPPIPTIGHTIRMGTKLCDQIFSYLAKEAGLQVFNPCLDVHTWHVHSGEARTRLGMTLRQAKAMIKHRLPHLIPFCRFEDLPRSPG